MKSRYLSSVGAAALLAACINTCCLAASHTAWELVSLMGTGMNLGNTFDAPDGEGTWCPQPARPEYFDDFKAAGFRHVRLPVTWGKHLQASEPYAVDPAF